MNMDQNKQLVLAIEGLSGKTSLGQQGKGVAKSGKGRKGAVIDLAAAGSAAAVVTSPWGKTAGVAKVNKYRKMIHVYLSSHAYDDADYHLTRDSFLSRCLKMEWAKDIHDWPRIIEYMEGSYNL